MSSKNPKELYRKAQRAEALSADLVEVRLDELGNHQGISTVAKSVEIPVVATNRPVSQKGSFAGPESERLSMLMDAVEGGAAYVDIESSTSHLDQVIDTFRKTSAKIILSHHDHSRTPRLSELKSTLTKLQKNNSDLYKIVTTARSLEDNLTILNLLKTNPRNNPLVSFAMGKPGVWSRILAPFYGADFTYASLKRGLETAPGQPSISELRRIYETIAAE
ncbi:MAG TPA: type I 3-dehydroquinate dehydratase [Candidatus Angelobacter sp.]|nr:type I 3-dehydroquinate dehydratase [Candidatus Angelobacter sp.]